MNGNSYTGRRLTLVLAGLIAVAGMTMVLAVSGVREGHAADHSHGAAMSVHTSKQLPTCRRPRSGCCATRSISATQSSRSMAPARVTGSPSC